MTNALKNEVWRFLLAVEFLTRVPATPQAAYSKKRFADSVRHYPLVGMLIGIVAAAVFLVAARYLPHVIAVLLSTAFVMLFTGAFHEDGLADTFDGIGGGGTAERSLEIMKDSRIGVFGMAALWAVLATKVSALNSMDSMAVAISLIAAHCMSRWSSVVAIASSSYVRGEGTGKPTAASISNPALLYASIVGLGPPLALVLVGLPIAAVGAAVGLVVGHVLMRLFYERKIGGYTGDCLGAVQQVSELGVYLGILACL